MNIKLVIENVHLTLKSNRKKIPDQLQALLLNGSDIAFHQVNASYFLLQELQINGFTIGSHHMSVQKTIKIDFVFTEKCAVLVFVLKKSLAVLKSDNLQNIPVQNTVFLYPSFYRKPMQLELNEGIHEFFCIAFSESMFEKLFPQGPDRPGKSSNYLNPSACVEITKKIPFDVKMVLQYAKSSPLPVFYINRRCIDLLSRFTKDLTASIRLQKWIDQKQPELESFKKEIELHLADHDFLRKRIPSLANQMNITMYQFKKISNQAFGMSLSAFIKAKRMEKAMGLLTETTIPIGEIAMAVGYNEFSGFSRAFTIFFGTPPSHHRAKS